MFVIVTALSLGVLAQVRDTALISTPVFKAVIDHAAGHHPSRPGLRVVLSNRAHKRECMPLCRDTTSVGHSIPPDVLRDLQASGTIVDSCYGDLGCPSPSGQTFVRLSIPYRLPAGFRVLAGEGNPMHVLGSESDRGEIVHIGLEVLVYGPCPKEREPCEFPDIVMYQYYLQEQADRSYRVVSRVVTGRV